MSHVGRLFMFQCVSASLTSRAPFPNAWRPIRRLRLILLGVRPAASAAQLSTDSFVHTIGELISFESLPSPRHHAHDDPRFFPEISKLVMNNPLEYFAKL